MSGFRAIAGSQSIDTDRRLAVKNGRSPACRPSMIRSSTSTLPVSRWIRSAPMRSGRSMYFDPSVSARCLTAGPRSTVTDATIAAARSATTSDRQNPT